MSEATRRAAHAEFSGLFCHSCKTLRRPLEILRRRAQHLTSVQRLAGRLERRGVESREVELCRVRSLDLIHRGVAGGRTFAAVAPPALTEYRALRAAAQSGSWQNAFSRSRIVGDEKEGRESVLNCAGNRYMIQKTEIYAKRFPSCTYIRDRTSQIGSVHNFVREALDLHRLDVTYVSGECCPDGS